MTTTESRTPDQMYHPISCDVYSRLELAIMHRERLRLTWREGNVFFAQLILPTDLETSVGEEFLHCRLPSGEKARIRIDHIDRM
ncbi:MAG: Rho-binding antiterminator, partial [Sulfurifustis sp.]